MREGKYEVEYVIEINGVPVAVEVKSGKKKPQGGLSALRERYPNADVILINTENFTVFLQDPLAIINKAIM